ncbi:MAG: ASKHA domain-containing protein [Anaerolineae bacterium]
MATDEMRAAMCSVLFRPSGQVAQVAAGTTLSEAARLAGVRLNLPCGGQGRCGRCLVRVEQGDVSRRPSAKLAAVLEQDGYALACLTAVQGDVTILVPEQEEMERVLVPAGLASEKGSRPEAFFVTPDAAVRRVSVNLAPPTLEDNTADLDRLRRHLSAAGGISPVQVSLPLVRRLGRVLRDADWQVTATVEDAACGEGFTLVDVNGDGDGATVGVAIDIGTTSNVVQLVDLDSGKPLATASTYNAQISCGEDVISRIIYARRDGGLQHLQSLVADTLSDLIRQAADSCGVDPARIARATVAGNTTMMQLFLAVDPQPIRLAPYIPAMTHSVAVRAGDVGLCISPEATVDCLPNVGAYVGADITSGVLASGMTDSDELSLFIDIGTNGEMVLGNSDFLVCCACSAGPAFEGGGVEHGMRAAAGAIDGVWIGSDFEPTWRVIGDVPPRGICGSGMISLLAEMFATGLVERGGRIQRSLGTPRVRSGDHGTEYVLAWQRETGLDSDIVITDVDIENLVRTKAAIYAGMMVLLESVGTDLSDLGRVLIGGGFGQYIDIEKAIQIGLLPDLPWDRFRFLGNTSLAGAYQSLASRERRRRVDEIGAMMTYLELSADNRFMEAFTAAMFLPHTDIRRFPTVQAMLGGLPA